MSRILRHFKFIISFLALTLLTACSNFEGFYNKFVPENVRAMDETYVAALMARDTAPFMELRGDLSEEEFKTGMEVLFEYVSDGDVIRRDVVGVSTDSSFGTEGRQKTIVNIFEVQTEEGFTLIELTYNLDEQGACCSLRHVNVDKFDNSPVRRNLETVAKIFKVVGGVVM